MSHVPLRMVSLAMPLLTHIGWVTGASAQVLPSTVQAAIRNRYDAQTRYLDGHLDLNGDGKDEILVHLVGPMACGTGGCPTLVFTAAGSGYRLVTTISVTRPPIRAAAAKSQGWRNLIVQVGGGGGESGSRELLFDGKSYPTNPTVSGPRVKTASAPGGEMVIANFKDFSEAKPLPKAGSAAGAAGPSFDCGKASSAVEKAICGDSGLSSLDRKLAEVYSKALNDPDWPVETKQQQRVAQVNWLAARNACGGQSNRMECIDGSYRRRIGQLQIMSGQLMAPTPVSYSCTGRKGEPFTVAYYSQLDPKAAVITFAGRQAIAFIQQTASGARYLAPSVEFWEQHGQATVTWYGSKYNCAVSR